MINILVLRYVYDYGTIRFATILPLSREGRPCPNLVEITLSIAEESFVGTGVDVAISELALRRPDLTVRFEPEDGS